MYGRIGGLCAIRSKRTIEKVSNDSIDHRKLLPQEELLCLEWTVPERARIDQSVTLSVMVQLDTFNLTYSPRAGKLIDGFLPGK